jgi:membrane protein YdbS with pleckstrin-like domain
VAIKSLGEGERVVLHLRTHPKALVLPVLCLVVALVIGVLAQVWLPSIVALVVWILVALAAVWWSLRPFLEWLVTTYTFTNRRLITRRGILTRRGHDIPLTRVSDVESEVDLIDRVFGCGTLVISDASTNGSVRLHDIPRVEDAQRILSELLHPHDDGS